MEPKEQTMLFTILHSKWTAVCGVTLLLLGSVALFIKILVTPTGSVAASPTPIPGVLGLQTTQNLQGDNGTANTQGSAQTQAPLSPPPDQPLATPPPPTQQAPVSTPPPTLPPTPAPSPTPSPLPTITPSAAPTESPSPSPSSTASPTPTASPSATPKP